MNLSDSELIMLENLTYIDDNFYSEMINIKNINQYNTVGEFLNQFTEDVLSKMDKITDPIDGGLNSGKEWAAMIRYMKSSKEICSLKISEIRQVGNTTDVICFEDPDNSDNAIVTFRGTINGEEWKDNVEGLNCADTESQKEALDYIESLPYDDIIVVGHSKGGNKAQYTAILSDKVTYCVSVDGQGFSKEFIRKYGYEIDSNASKIHAYSLSSDFVHILLFKVAGAEYIYCQGYGVDDVAQHHSPDAFFNVQAGLNGEWVIALDENGKPLLTEVNEDSSLTMLHEFTCFILNTANDKEKEMMVTYISNILSTVFGSNEGKDEIIDVVLSDKNTLAMLLAYLVKYMEVYQLSSDDVNDLLEVLGINELNYLIKLKEYNLPFEIRLDVYLNLENIIDILKFNLTDGEKDWIIIGGLNILDFFKVPDDMDLDISELYSSIEEYYQKIGDVNPETAILDADTKSNEIRDYSKETYEKIMEIINQIGYYGSENVSSWNEYVDEEWYDSLFISAAVNGINAYYEELTEINNNCRIKVEEKFTEIGEIDGNYAEKISVIAESINKLKTDLVDYMARISVV